MKRKFAWLLSVLLLCGCTKEPLEEGRTDDNSPPEGFELVTAGPMTFHVNDEYTVDNPQNLNLGVYQFVDAVYYVGMQDDTTYVIGHLKDDVYQDLQETTNVAVTYFHKAYGIEVTGEKYNPSDILEDACELGEIGYHLKFLQDNMCILAYKPNSITDDMSMMYYNEVDNTVFDNIIVGEATTSFGGPVAEPEVIASYQAVGLAGDVVAYTSMYNSDNSICMLLQKYSGLEWQNNIDNRYTYDEDYQMIVDSVTGNIWSPTWMVNPDREEKPKTDALPSETFGTE